MGTPVQKGTTAALIESAESPIITLGEQVTRKRIYNGVYSVCLANALARGTPGADDEAGFVVRECVVRKAKGAAGVLEITWEVATSQAGQTLPPDQWWLKPFNQAPKVYRKPVFQFVEEWELDLINKAINGKDELADDARNRILVAGSEEANQLLALMRKGHETYYFAGLKYIWVTNSYTLPALTLGGFIDTPTGPGVSALPADASWLRESDDLDASGGFYKITRTWVGSTAGYWDETLYSR